MSELVQDTEIEILGLIVIVYSDTWGGGGAKDACAHMFSLEDILVRTRSKHGSIISVPVCMRVLLSNA